MRILILLSAILSLNVYGKGTCNISGYTFPDTSFACGWANTPCPNGGVHIAEQIGATGSGNSEFRLRCAGMGMGVLVDGNGKQISTKVSTNLETN